jgi:hypothetical protein
MPMLREAIEGHVDLEAYSRQIIEEFSAGTIDLPSAKGNLIIVLEVAMGGEQTDACRQKLGGFAGDLLSHVEAEEIDTETAASDLIGMIRAAKAKDPSFNELLDIGEE